MVSVPELNQHVAADGSINLSDTTQARRVSEIVGQARDCTITVDGIDVTTRAGRVANDRALAERHAAAAQEEARELARDLAAHGVAVRDVGEVLGVSFQRAQQLISA